MEHLNGISLKATADNYRDLIGEYRHDLPLKAKEDIANKIVWYSLNDNFNNWAQDHPELLEIQAIANDLSWSNSNDIDGDWEKLRGYIEMLKV